MTEIQEGTPCPGCGERHFECTDTADAATGLVVGYVSRCIGCGCEEYIQYWEEEA